MTTRNQQDLRLAETCYWAIIDPRHAGVTALIRRPSIAVRRKLTFLAEAQVPVPVEGLHAAFAPLPDGRTAVCLVDRDTVQTACDTGADSLVPADVPDEIEAERAAFELLTAEFEPRAHVARRRIRATIAAATIGLCASIGAAGLLHRAKALTTAANDLEAAATIETEAVLAGIGNPRLPIEARLTQHLRRLQGTRAADTPSGRSSVNAAERLASVLAHWPTGTTAQTDRVSVGFDDTTISVTFDKGADAEKVLAAYRQADAWSVPDHSLDRQRTRSGERTRLRFTLVGAAEGEGDRP